MPAFYRHDAGATTANGSTIECLPGADPVQSAEAAGLRYVTDQRPGISRRRAGKGFSYTRPDGTTITEAETLARIRGLAVPPAWKHVWICPSPDGHIQATGWDSRGRKQYRYHPRWREVRDATKYEKMVAFAKALPALRQRVEEDLARRGLPREKVLAAIVRLLETTLIRVGNDEYSKANDSYGLTTMRDGHVAVNGSAIRFEFRGKSGIDHEIDLRDARLARIVGQCQDLPGQELFAYLDEDGDWHDVSSSDVNAYLREITNEDFTAKDFRTWMGTVMAAEALAELDGFASPTAAKRKINQAVDRVASRLRNTRAVCRKCYIHPDVIESYLGGTLADTLARYRKQRKQSPTGLRGEEAAVLGLLKERAKRM